MPTTKAAVRGKARPATAKRPTWGLSNRVLALIGAGLLVLGGIYWMNAGSAGGKFNFEVGSPGPGEMAPPIRLDSAEGDRFDLAAQRGKRVLLYFQEGVMCDPCWQQIIKIEANMEPFRDLGIDQIVSITTDPADILKQAKAHYRISTPVLSDPDLSVSRTYDTNSYGMMGGTHNGHSFIVVAPDGRIEWRADYGGAPDYTMFLPVEDLLADLRRGLGE